MSQPLNVNPDDMLVLVHGHLLLINQLGQAQEVTPPAPDGPLSSQAGVAALYGSTSALTSAMMGRLGEHSAGFTAASAQYQGQEHGSMDVLKDAMSMATGMAKDFEGAGMDVFKQGTGIITQGMTALSQAGGALASGVAPLLSPLAQTAHITPLSGDHAHDAAPTGGTQHHGEGEHDSHPEPGAGPDLGTFG